MDKTLWPDAVAAIKGGERAPDLRGDVKFYQKERGVLVAACVTGLPKENPTGFFGFHIHEGNACAGADFADTLSHWNPEKLPHPKHAGDLPPLLSCRGEANMTVLTDRFTVEEILGRTVVIHDRPDDFTTQPAGNAGRKIACGVIRKTDAG